MLGLPLIREIENLLLDKLDRQETCQNFYERIDDSIRQDLLMMTFEQIDQIENEIQSMDLIFLSRLEKFKSLNGIKDIGELIEAEKKAFTLIQKAVIQVAERERAIETMKNETWDIRHKTETKVKKTSRENKAYSAYKNINK